MKEDSTFLTFDDQARQRIRSSLEESLLVEAAAGTGKTSELVRRLVAILATGRTVANRIVAVTFTRKAAGELRLRLREGLDKARAEAEDADAIFNLEQAIVQIEEARIGTIHSFCSDLLRERPVEARVDPSFEELSEEEAPRMFDVAFRRWIEEKLANTPPGLRRALSRSLGRQDFYSSLSPLESIKQVGWKLLEWRDYQRRWRREDFDREFLVDGLITLVEELSEISWKCRNWRDELRQGLRPVRDLATWV